MLYSTIAILALSSLVCQTNASRGLLRAVIPAPQGRGRSTAVEDPTRSQTCVLQLDEGEEALAPARDERRNCALVTTSTIVAGTARCYKAANKYQDGISRAWMGRGWSAC